MSRTVGLQASLVGLDAGCIARFPCGVQLDLCDYFWSSLQNIPRTQHKLSGQNLTSQLLFKVANCCRCCQETTGKNQGRREEHFVFGAFFHRRAGQSMWRSDNESGGQV